MIFLHRARSLAPYTRHLPQHQLLDILEVVESGEKTTLKGDIILLVFEGI